jgi:hypothetical protein
LKPQVNIQGLNRLPVDALDGGFAGPLESVEGAASGMSAITSGGCCKVALWVSSCASTQRVFCKTKIATMASTKAKAKKTAKAKPMVRALGKLQVVR